MKRFNNHLEIVFVDWAPIEIKSNIRSGIAIRRYYAWKELNDYADIVIPFRKKDGNVNWKAIKKLFQKDSKIWVEYGCGGIAHLCVLLASLIQPGKTLILNVHDFIAKGMTDTDGKVPIFKRLRTEILEQLLLKRANVIIFPTQGLLDWFTPRKNQRSIIMMPGVGEDELSIPTKNKRPKDKKTAIYFGSMRRKGIIPHIIELFSKLDGWELLLVGQKEGANIENKENVKYLGIVSHDELQNILDDADVILISLPNSKYFDRATPNKLAHALRTCKPVIATELSGISVYVSKVGLEDNVIYVKIWNKDTLEEALQKALNLKINPEKTIEKLKTMVWEPRFKKVIKIAMETNQKTKYNNEWI